MRWVWQMRETSGSTRLHCWRCLKQGCSSQECFLQRAQSAVSPQLQGIAADGICPACELKLVLQPHGQEIHCNPCGSVSKTCEPKSNLQWYLQGYAFQASPGNRRRSQASPEPSSWGCGCQSVWKNERCNVRNKEMLRRNQQWRTSQRI